MNKNDSIQLLNEQASIAFCMYLDDHLKFLQLQNFPTREELSRSLKKRTQQISRNKNMDEEIMTYNINLLIQNVEKAQFYLTDFPIIKNLYLKECKDIFLTPLISSVQRSDLKSKENIFLLNKSFKRTIQLILRIFKGDNKRSSATTQHFDTFMEKMNALFPEIFDFYRIKSPSFENLTRYVKKERIDAILE